MSSTVRHWFARVACGALVASLLATFLVAAPAVGAQSAFTDASGRFSFSVPDDWAEDEPDDGSIAVQFQVPHPLATFYVSTMPLPQDTSLEDFIPQVFAAFSAQFDDFSPAPVANTVVGGEQAKQVDIAAVASGQKVSLSEIFAVHDGTVYVLTIATPVG